MRAALTADAVQAIGRALGTLAAERGDPEVMIGRDDRPESPALSEARGTHVRVNQRSRPI